MADTPEFPKVLVRVRRGGGGLVAEIREVADGDAETVATAEGFIVVEVPFTLPMYPKWVYHADGRRQVVASEADREALGEGWEDIPVDETAEEPAPEDVGTPA